MSYLEFEKTWEKEILGNGQESETAYSISITRDGKIYISSGTNLESKKNVFMPAITKIDAFGNIEWRRVFNSNSREYHQFRASGTKNGNLIIAGTSMQNTSLGYKSDAFITRIDSNGNILWTNAYGTADEDDWGWNLFEKPDGDIIMIGSTKSFKSSLFDIYLLGINANGK